MVLLPVNGVEIDFPYEPYGAQIRYMSNVIDSLRHGKNALLESPTGTGKTLCLLCAALAWRHTYIAALQARSIPAASAPSSLLEKAGVRPADNTNGSSALDVLIRPQSSAHLAAPRIIFSSRTHSQLAQAVSELKKTIYKPSMSILASRDQLCIHDISDSLSGSRLNSMCRRLTQKRECRYHLPIASSRPYENRSEQIIADMQAAGAMDIEELQDFGKNQGACPWFLSRAAAQADGCEILFLPYNYLLDKGIRSTLEIDWSNDIVIIDEAHNLESVCADSMSFDLTASLRSHCDTELSNILERGIRPGGLVIPALQQLEKTEKGLDSLIGSENRELYEIRALRTMLQTVDTFVQSQRLERGQNGDIAFQVYPGSRLRQLLQENQGPTPDTYELFLELLDRAMGRDAEINDTSRGNDGQRQSTPSTSAMKAIQTAIRVLFESTIGGAEKFFRTVIQESKSNPNAGRTISYWCFKPAIAMKTLGTLNLRCLLLTSGTLSPMDSFAAELGLDFPVRLENPHVVTKAQIWAAVLRNGPDVNGMRGTRLTSAYHARGEQTSIELGRTLIRIASVVPDGLLVFFPSYGSLHYSTDVWQKYGPFADRAKPSIWEHLLQKKPIVAEERDSSKFAAAILAHRTNVDNRHGSILLAVCRGKVSEGIDFSDEYGRAVVITGLPYPSAMDPKVVLKREFADEEARHSAEQNIRVNGKPSTLKVLSGSDWYTIQAIRAVNQAVGRAIRHRFDYGAILLCDERFQSKNLQQKVSKWIRSRITLCSTFEAGESSLQGFYAQAVTSQFAKEGEQKRLEAQKRLQKQATQQLASEAEKESVRTAQKLLKDMNPPPTTDREFLDELMAFSDRFKGDKPLKKKEQSSTQKASPAVKVLDFGSQEVRGGMLDSGSLRLSVTKNTQPDGVNGSKRNATFLAAQPEAIDSDEDCGTKAKRVRTQEPLNKQTLIQAHVTKRLTETRKAPILTNGSSRKPKLSDRIRTLFSGREDQRQFLKLFREVLTHHSRIKEGVGPLQNLDQLTQNRHKAKQAVENVVTFTREHGSSATAQSTFLYELRTKVPGTLLSVYDDAVSRVENDSHLNHDRQEGAP